MDIEKQKEIIAKLNDNYKAIQEHGYKLQKEGNKLVFSSRVHQETLNYFSENVIQIDTFSKDYPSFGSSTALNAYYNYLSNQVIVTDGFLSLLSTNEEEINRINNSISADSTSGATSIYQITGSIVENYENKDGKNVFDDYKISEPKFTFNEEIQNKLDDYFKKYFPENIERRKGAWTTYHSVSEDKLAQAAHSMRDILAKIISDWASNEKVESEEWWQKIKNDYEKINLKHRLRLLLYGSKDPVENEELEIMESKVKEYLDEDKFLKGVAHGSINFKKSIEYAMRSIETCMLNIFEVKEKIENVQ